MAITGEIKRLSLRVKGIVQGVGFRPFVYRLAKNLELTGWVCNSARGLEVEVEGPPKKLEQFQQQVREANPPPARIQKIEAEFLPPADFTDFEIRESDSSGTSQVHLLPDLATCEDCLEELKAPEDPRHQYPFINCTNCGPRYSIIEALPYDRPKTTMKKFEMCIRCRREYEAPLDRRFHAQPNACPECGPHLQWTNSAGEVESTREAALAAALEQLRAGQIVALKGLGGFHLLVDSRKETAINRLRKRKRRPAKAFALMYPSLEKLEGDCFVNPAEAELLNSAAAPIVLLKSRLETAACDAVAPDSAELGAMLPYTPLHHLVLTELDFPLVATSGNQSGEPICFKTEAARDRLTGIADGFLVHDRPIVRPVDDSVARVINDKPQLVRRARGYAPAPLEFPQVEPNILALGGQLKNTVALNANDGLVVSQHLGDLESPAAVDNFQKTVGDLEEIYDFTPELLVADQHPDYYPTTYADQRPERVIRVQHHHAHVAGAMVDHGLTGSVFGVAWDGTGFGADETVWGGEFMRADRAEYKRVAHFRQFQLPGGEKAVKEPRRTALSVVQALGPAAKLPAELDESFEAGEVDLLRDMLENNVNAPLTSSVGRLFDAAAALLGLSFRNEYLGQAPIQLETAARKTSTKASFTYKISESEAGALVVDWAPLFEELLAAQSGGEKVPELAARFHNTLAEIIVELAMRQQEKRVVLTGGCFQNRYLTERTLELTAETELEIFFHQQVPPNDGGLAVGQAAIAAARVKRDEL